MGRDIRLTRAFHLAALNDPPWERYYSPAVTPHDEEKRLMRMLAAAVLLLLAAPQARAVAPNIVDQLKLSEYVQSLKFGGDFRLRDEYFDRRSPGTTNRHRQRYRLRLGAEILLPHDLLTYLRLASGQGEQVSTNYTFDNLSQQKEIWIDQIYLKWGPKLTNTITGFVAGGKMQNFLWRTYSSDILWDDDFNPEGLYQGGEWIVAEDASVFVNAVQMLVDEDSNTPREQWSFSQQAGFETRLPWETRLRLAAAYHKWSDENRSTFGQRVVLEGNRRTAAGILVNRFGVGEVTGQLSGWAGRLPLAAQATIIRNLRARDDLAGGRTQDGYQFGLVVGKAKTAGTWEAAWFKKYSQTDATVADVADSDFGDGGTNKTGHIWWLAYAPLDWLIARAKFFSTKTIDAGLAPGARDVNRFQLDFSLKF